MVELNFVAGLLFSAAVGAPAGSSSPLPLRLRCARSVKVEEPLEPGVVDVTACLRVWTPEEVRQR